MFLTRVSVSGVVTGMERDLKSSVRAKRIVESMSTRLASSDSSDTACLWMWTKDERQGTRRGR